MSQHYIDCETIRTALEQNQKMREAIERSLIKHKAYVGICEGDKELNQAIIPMLEQTLKEIDQ